MSKKQSTSKALSSAALAQFGQDEFGDRLQCLEDALSRGRDRVEFRHLIGIEKLLKFFEGRHVGQVPLVVLNNVGELIEVVTLLGQIGTQVVERFDIRFEAVNLAVGDIN